MLGVADRAADGRGAGALRRALLGARARPDRRRQPAVGRRRPGAGRGGAAGVRAAAALGRRRRTGFGLSSGSVRITAGTNRRLRLFAVTQIAASFVLLAGAGMLLTTLLALQAARTGFDTRNVLAVNVPVMSYGRTPEQIAGFYKEAMRRIARAARRRARRRRHDRAVARRRHVRSGLSVLGRGLRQGRRRRGSARAVPHGLARILRGARRADHRRPRLHRRRSPRRRAGRHRQPEPGAADVPEPGRGQPPPDVDRSGDEVHRRQHRRRGASSASPPTSTTRTSCPGRR